MSTLKPGRGDAGIPQPPQHEREGRQAQVRFGLAAARGEEQQVHDLAVGVRRVGDARQVHQDERKLERPPLGRDRRRVLLVA